MRFTVDEAQTHFSKLLAAVESGEEVTIYRDGKAVVVCVPAKPPAPFPFGIWAKDGTESPSLDHMVGPTDASLLGNKDD
ncbi:type II toxin-antitoxin system Phd/YefM family antitoxin [Denitrobaculum tricleocarpae]|uniref:Antitoxin n=1 Tax=Denitrobaculum tricleocarpae TaxID=2591009 RepID=A0A545TEW4_9PROT|nr:type II toxin-antitoxin system prevent-host-death family antitoxin [Denitrobaculum tricleocarpae]